VRGVAFAALRIVTAPASTRGMEILKASVGKLAKIGYYPGSKPNDYPLWPLL
jgi:hypothetical protein